MTYIKEKTRSSRRHLGETCSPDYCRIRNVSAPCQVQDETRGVLGKDQGGATTPGPTPGLTPYPVILLLS